MLLQLLLRRAQLLLRRLQLLLRRLQLLLWRLQLLPLGTQRRGAAGVSRERVRGAGARLLTAAAAARWSKAPLSAALRVATPARIRLFGGRQRERLQVPARMLGPGPGPGL